MNSRASDSTYSVGKFHTWIWLIVFAAAILVRGLSLPGRSWWIDEVITRNVGALPLWKPGIVDVQLPASHSILAFCLHDSGPGPLTYLVEGVLAKWARPFHSEYLIRLPGIAASLLGIVLVWRRGRYWMLGRLGSLVMGVTLATIPELVDWSTGARGYAWVMLVGFLQWDLLLKLAGRCFIKGRANKYFLGLGILANVGLLFHQVHLVWNVAILLGFLAIRNRRGRSAAASVSKPCLIGTVLITAMVHIAWLYLWKTGMGTRGEQLASLSFAASLAKLNSILASPLNLVWILAMLVSCFFVSGYLFSHRATTGPVWVVPAVVNVLSVLLFFFVASRFILAPRYFYALSICVIWGGAICVASLVIRATSFIKPNKRRLVEAAVIMFFIIITIQPAARRAATPVHNWSQAVLWLKQNAGPRDIIIAGPNADHEILSVYAKAANLSASIPRYLHTPDGQVFDPFTEAGLSQALDSRVRLWFVTPFFGNHRTPRYWQNVQSNFREAARIPGKGEIVILVHDDRATTSIETGLPPR